VTIDIPDRMVMGSGEALAEAAASGHPTTPLPEYRRNGTNPRRLILQRFVTLYKREGLHGRRHGKPHGSPPTMRIDDGGNRSAPTARRIAGSRDAYRDSRRSIILVEVVMTGDFVDKLGDGPRAEPVDYSDKLPPAQLAEAEGLRLGQRQFISPGAVVTVDLFGPGAFPRALGPIV
jgi:hypothetical protein